MKASINSKKTARVEKKESPSYPLIFSGEKDYLVENLSVLVSSGMGIVAAVEAIEREVRPRRVKRLLSQLRDDINMGVPLWESLERTRLFDESTIALIKVGEESGRLSANLKLVSLQEQKNRMFRSKIRSAMTYPVIVLALALVVGVGAAWFVLPKLAMIFSQLDVDLPLASRIMIKIGGFMKVNGLAFMTYSTLGIVVLLSFLFGFRRTRFIGQGLLLHTPGIRRMIMEAELSRLGFILSTLIVAGVPVVKALESLSNSSPLTKYKKIYQHLRDEVSNGKTFRDSFASYPKSGFYVPASIQQMIASGEQSGNLAEMLASVGDIYESRLDVTAKNLTTILEPVLLLVIGLIVLWLALAIILPIYGLLGGVDGRDSAPRASSPTASEEPVDTSTEINAGNAGALGDTKALPRLTTLLVEEGLVAIYNQPSRSGEVIARVGEGEVFEYLNQDKEWFEIVLPGVGTGWINGYEVDLLE